MNNHRKVYIIIAISTGAMRVIITTEHSSNLNKYTCYTINSFPFLNYGSLLFLFL